MPTKFIHILVKKLLLTLLLFSFIQQAMAQNFAVKTNLLYDATATVNAGVEVGLASKWTLDISGNLNAWVIGDGHKLKHWMVQPEARYWFCERFNGHFLALHTLGGEYNFGNIPNKLNYWPFNTDLTPLNDYRFQGWGIGAGLGYGYSFILGHHWNLELEIGLGYIYTLYDVYQCRNCGRKIKEKQNYHYVGPTKAAINLVYEF